MAVPKSKTSKSTRGQRRSHDGINSTNISFNSITGEPHYSHMMSKDGIYKGKKIINKKQGEEKG